MSVVSYVVVCVGYFTPLQAKQNRWQESLPAIFLKITTGGTKISLL
jgi:hypothetical protein